MTMPDDIAGHLVSDIVYRSTRTTIVRAVRERDERTVILKMLSSESPEPLHCAQLRHEYALLSELEIPGVIRSDGLLEHHGSPMLVLEDLGARSLQAHLRHHSRLDIATTLDIAVQIASTLALLHQRDIVHKDINPGNVLWQPDTARACVIDFGISSRVSHERDDRASSLLEGTPAYLAPEQTGRINRTIEARSDLYSLGVTLFELLSGETPFTADDLAGYVHSHLARTPPRLHEVMDGVPRPLSDLVSRLLAKRPEDRPRGAYLVKAELEAYRSQWQQKRAMVAVSVPETLDRFAPLQKLYGRERELDELVAAFERVCRGGTCEAVFVSGPSGIGKSALAAELKLPVLLAGGHYTAGKFEQYQRDVPYQALITALDAHLRYLLTLAPEALERWRDELRAAVGGNARLVCDVVPAFVHLVGQPEPVPALGPLEEQRRFHQTFKRFIAALGRVENPLMLVIDDLQWADGGSLGLLEEILLDGEIRGLLLVGSYREEDVAGTPLAARMKALEAASVLRVMALEPLEVADVVRMIVDLFGVQASDAVALASVVSKNAAGNPFFVIELLRTLSRDRLIGFDRDTGAWKWDMTEIVGHGIADNVASLLSRRLGELPDETQRSLQVAACMGNRFDLHMVSMVLEQPLPACARALWPAVTMGLIKPADHSHELMVSAEATDGLDDHALPAVRDHFVHDRVHQAVYDSIAEADRARLHLPIGRLLLSRLENTDSVEAAESSFEVADHVNMAAGLVHDDDERRRYARVNLAAGQRAKAANAHVEAIRYLRSAVDWLSERASPWETDASLSFHIHRTLGEALYLQGEIDHGVAVLETALARTDDTSQRCELYVALVNLHAGQRHRDSIDAGKRALELLGRPLPSEGLTDATAKETSAIDAMLADISVPSLSQRPSATDSETRMALLVLARLGPPTFMVDPVGLFPLCVARAVRISIEHGHVPESYYSFAAYAALLRMDNRLAMAAEFGNLAVTLCQLTNDKVQTALVYQAYVHCSLSFKQSVKDARFFGETGYRCAIDVGEPGFASLSLLAVALSEDFLSRDTARTITTIEHALDFAQKNREEWSARCLQSALWHNLALRGRDDEFDQNAFLSRCQNPLFGGELAYHYTFQSNIDYLTGNYRKAWTSSCRAAEYVDHIKPFIHWYHHMFYRAMIALELLDDVAGHDTDQRIHESDDLRGSIEDSLSELAPAAEQCPTNFAHLYLLIQARKSQGDGDLFAAVQRYEQAAQSAQEHGYTGMAALASELCGRLWQSQGNDRLANLYLRAAYRGYQSWGVRIKTDALRPWRALRVRELGRTLDPELTTTRPPVIETHSTTDSTGRVLDAAAVVKASQVIAQAIRREDVIVRLVEIAVEAAGAQRGLLIASDDDGLTVQAQFSLEGQGDDADEALDEGGFSRGAVMYTMRTKDEVVVDDARGDSRFASDPHVVERGPRSLLCLPVFHAHGRETVLYLENSLLPGAFSAERMEVVRLLAAQAAISLDNARLYDKLEAKVKERTRDLEATQAQLLVASRMAGQSDVAAIMLHNVGNVLTGAMTAAGELREAIKGLNFHRLSKAVKLLETRLEAAPTGQGHPENQRLAKYLRLLDERSAKKRQGMLETADTLNESLTEIATTLMSQREYITPYSVAERFPVQDVVSAAAVLMSDTCKAKQIAVTYEVANELTSVTCDRYKLVQILRCVLENAVEALEDCARNDKRIEIRARSGDSGTIELEIADNGPGIAHETLDEIFRFGYTSRANKRGYGLHMSANMATELGGRLWAESDGPERGARLILQLPGSSSKN